MKKLISTSLLLFIGSVFTFGQDVKRGISYSEELIQIDSSEIILIPLRYAPESTISSKAVNWNNLYTDYIFYNSQKNTYHKLLGDKKGYVLPIFNNYNRYNVEQPKTKISDEFQLRKHLIIPIIAEDFNEDGKITVDDPTQLVIVDKNGQNPIRITPSGYDYVSFKSFESLGFILVLMRKDSDDNKKFNNQDQQVYFRVDLNDLKNAYRVIEKKE